MQEATEGGEVSPFLGDRPLAGVAAAFKRFFAPVCELQVLLRAERGAALWASRRRGQERGPCGLGDAVVEVLVEVLARTLRSPPATREALCALMERDSRGEARAKVRQGGGMCMCACVHD